MANTVANQLVHGRDSNPRLLGRKSRYLPLGQHDVFKIPDRLQQSLDTLTVCINLYFSLVK